MSARPLVRYAALAAVALVVAIAIGLFLTHRAIRWRDTAGPPGPAADALQAFSAGDLDRGIPLLHEAERRYDAPYWEPKVRLAGASRALAADRPEVALQLLTGRESRDDLLAPWIALARAQALLAKERLDEAASEAARATVPGFPSAEEAATTAAGALERAGREADALRALDAVPALRLAAGELEGRAGNRAEARRRLVTIVLEAGDDGPEAIAALLALEKDAAARFAGTEPAAIAAAARRFTESRQGAAALALLRATVPPGASAASRHPDLALAEAEACFAVGRIAETRPLLARARAGTATTVDGALYLAARIDEARGRASVSAAELAALARRPGRSPAKLAALADLAQIVEGAPNPRALAAWRRYREAAGDAADPVALLREGFAALELGRRPEADAAFARVLAMKDAPAGARAAAAYWAARRAEQSGRRPEARRLDETVVGEFPNHVYGVFAERRLSRPPPAPADDGGELLDADDARDGERWLLAARALSRLSLDAWSDAAYRAAAAAAPEQAGRRIRLEAADAALERGQATEAKRWILAAIGDRDRAPLASLPRRHWKVLLPVPPSFDLDGAARAARVEAPLVAAVVMEESAFDPRAVSFAGARGLLQLMPATGAEIARSVGIRGFTAERLFEPEVNLRLGTVYLRRLLDRYGSRAPALAAYNAGPARSDRWTLPSDDPLGDRFTERIPIPATRLYVKRILANERLYRIVWGSSLEARDR